MSQLNTYRSIEIICMRRHNFSLCTLGGTLAAVLVAITLLSGCAGDRYWKQGKTNADYARDAHFCNTDALIARDCGEITEKTFDAYKKYYELCLYRAGWTKVNAHESEKFGFPIPYSDWLDSMKQADTHLMPAQASRALIYAASAGDNDLIKKWLRRDVDVNHAVSQSEGGKGYTALYAAAERGRTSTVELLLCRGANPKIQLGADSCCPGWTPLMIAAAERHSDTVKLLLMFDADVNARNKLGRTALMFAANYGVVPIVEMLLEHGADPNMQPMDEVGMTALMAAIRGGHTEAVKVLLDKGADYSIRDASGLTALGLAKKQGFSEIQNLLEARGAKE